MKKTQLLILALLLSALSFNCSSRKGKVNTIPNGVELQTATQSISVQFCANNAVHVTKCLNGEKPDTASLVVIQKKFPEVKFEIQEDEKQIAIVSDALKVIITKADGKIEYQSKDGKTILKEAAEAAITDAELKNEKAFHIKQNFELSADEAIYGLGQHQNGYMNYRGKTVKLVQANTEAVTPFLISSSNYGILWDNYSKTIFEDKDKETSLFSDVAQNITYYFVSGENMDNVIAGYRTLTGQAPMYGRWAYGYWQSKEHYENRDDLLKIAAEFRKRKIPIDNMIQDWDYWPDTKSWGQLFFDEKKYPNAKEMVDILHKDNFHLMISIWCSFGPHTPVYKEMEKNGFLYPAVGWAGFKYYDAYNPAARDLFWKYTNQGLFSLGLDGWWMDSTEPDVINAITKEGTEYEMKRMPNNHLGSFAKYLNPYSLLATESVYKNQRKTSEKQRVYILTRSTFAGQQRAAATTWSGDIGANWNVYKNQITAGLNHSMSGIPYWTFDIGAFVLGAYDGVFCNGGKDPAYQELYTRMFQFGTFCPIFRSHGSETPREPWEFGEFSNTIIKFDNLRYRLMPYIYSLAGQVTHNGYTYMRGLAMDFNADKKVYNIGDQFMFGNALMVCPVTEYQKYRPLEASVPVRSKFFKTKDGKAGLVAKYYKDTKYKLFSKEQIDSCININWYATGRPSYVTDSTMAITWEGKITPNQTGKHQFHVKCFGPKRIFINGKELKMVYTSVEQYTELIDLEAGKEYDFRMETENATPGALRVELFWKTPAEFAKEKIEEKRKQTRNVYLPAGNNWIDFWTGETLNGGQNVEMPAPIESIPILVKAGSILPMGPFVQYANEKLAEPLEIRVYPGANGSFVLYEDEGDNYNYEKGAFSNISFKWDDAKRQLTISKREGKFAGMQEKRSFKITVVSKTSGKGMEISKPNKTIDYSGEEISVKF